MLGSNYYYGTTSVAALYAGDVDAYAIGGVSPATVADFAGVLNSGTEYYRTGGSETTFDDMFSYSDTGSLGVMTDSDGALKWKPHNIVANFSSANWDELNGTMSSSISDPDGGTDAYRLTDDNGTDTVSVYTRNNTPTWVSGATYTYGLKIKNNSGVQWVALTTTGLGTNTDYVYFDIQNGVKGNERSSGQGSISDLGGGWYYITSEIVPTGTSGYVTLSFSDANGTNAFPTFTTNGSSVDIYQPRVYRSDLGGMVDNPDRGDSYVPTTTAARFLARRNHYRYNGASYSKKGILLESAAATNTALYSDFSVNTTSGLSVTNNNAEGPDGISTSASTLTAAGSGTAVQYCYNTTAASQATATDNAQSIIVKAGTSDYVVISACRVSPANTEEFYSAVFDVGASSTQTAATETDVGTTAGTLSATYQEALGGGWFRCTLVGYVGRTSINLTVGFAEAATGNTFDANGHVTHSTGWSGETLLVYHRQSEGTSSLSSSIIPTSGATATRAAETLTIAGSDMAVPATTGYTSIHMQGEISYSDNGTVIEQEFYKWPDSSTESVYGRLVTTTALTGTVRVGQHTVASGYDEVSSSAEYTPGLNVAFNFAARHGVGAINVAKDGTAGTANTSMSDFTDLSGDTFVFKKLSGTIALFRQDDSDWTDTGIEEATS